LVEFVLLQLLNEGLGQGLTATVFSRGIVFNLDLNLGFRVLRGFTLIFNFIWELEVVFIK
jgi:hypothetical protein